MDLRNKRVLVTGANGFIGSHLVKRLAEVEGAHVMGLVRKLTGDLESKRATANIHYVRGDITDRRAITQAVSGCHVVVHTAACQPFGPMPPRSQFNAVNALGTANLLEEFDPPGEGRFLLLSTINVHGLPPPHGVYADSPLRYSGDRYSDSKVDGERAAWKIARARGIPLTVVRPACTFGPGSMAWTLQPLDRIRRRTPVLIGVGQGFCNPIYVDNLVDLIIEALTNDAASNQGFIGSQGVAVEWREFFGYYSRMVGIPLRSVPLAAAVLVGRISSLYERATGRPGLLSRPSVAFYSHQVIFDAAKNQKLLGFAPRISFEEGMHRTEEWLRGEHLV